MAEILLYSWPYLLIAALAAMANDGCDKVVLVQLGWFGLTLLGSATGGLFKRRS
ncbi:MAG TPA: hypothetical protein VKC66_23460 [Xanthobacteraceae bacterium]|nr:hypothetical protein [Xanthobacteraceae bacterium]